MCYRYYVIEFTVIFAQLQEVVSWVTTSPQKLCYSAIRITEIVVLAYLNYSYSFVLSIKFKLPSKMADLGIRCWNKGMHFSLVVPHTQGA